MQVSMQIFASALKRALLNNSTRSLSVSPTLQNAGDAGGEAGRQSWLGKIFDRQGAGEVAVGPHAARLAESHHVYEMQTHRVKPRFMEEYLKQYTAFISMINSKQTGAELVGSWTVEIGNQDEAIHVWRYTDYKSLHDATSIYRNDRDFIQFRIERNKMLDHRRNLIMMKFSFWNDPEPRKFFGPDPSIYELRTYSLRPGNLIEWGNLWARGIKFRQLNNEAVCGWFEQMGDLYTVHHLWNYKDMQTRKETREAAWRHPGWDENVAYTVPLIRKMHSRILVPTPFSPLQ